MQHKRLGEGLWSEWSGDGFPYENPDDLVYVTEGRLDHDSEIARRALAYALQRDGVIETLGEAYKAVETGIWTEGFAGQLDEDDELTVCDPAGETISGENVHSAFEMTWVEVPSGS